jgi:hypothetical protein
MRAPQRGSEIFPKIELGGRVTLRLNATFVSRHKELAATTAIV